MLHKAYAGTAAACTAVAAALPGSVPQAVARPRPTGRCTLGHRSGVIAAFAEVRREAGTFRVESAAYSRTARRLLEGTAFVRAAASQPVASGAP